MQKIAFFDAKPYDMLWFDKLNSGYEITYHEFRLTPETARLADGCEVVCAFVNDELCAPVIDSLYRGGVRLIAMRCAGYSNVDFKAAYGKINVVRVPAYSPHAVAEHAMAMLLTLDRKLHKAYNRTRDFNFSINGLTGFVLHGKTAGVVGTGRIGQAFAQIAMGFGMKVLAYDAYPSDVAGVQYVTLPELLEKSDIVSLHCPLTEQSHHMIGAGNIRLMKRDAIVINTSRGALIDSAELLHALRQGRLGGACLDVYEEEADCFYEDRSQTGIHDDTLALLLALPNVLITSHQAFLTSEALESIAAVTYGSIDSFFSDGPLDNEICYYCKNSTDHKGCRKNRKQRCF